MAPLKILICGGGVGGPSLAYWLARAGHRVTVNERFPSLRDTGAQIDIRAQGIDIVKRMGLLDTIRTKLVDEAGVAFVNSRGAVRATILANISGKGAQSVTSEFEIMRGDLVRVLYDATKKSVEYLFGKTVETFTQSPENVIVTFSDNSTATYDLVIGADGQGSRTRRSILSPDAPSPYRRLGLHMAYFFIPRASDDCNIRRTYLAGKGRMIFRRTHNATETQIYLILKDERGEFSWVHRASEAQQKAFWTEKFRDAGWEVPRFLEGMKTTQNWYCQEVVQVKLPQGGWSRGRVALLGDAAYCPSPFTGMGTTSSFVGAYVLAAQINKHPEEPEKAFAEYESVMRPFVDEFQAIKPWLIRLAIAETAWGIWLIHILAAVLCWLRIPELLARLSPEDKGGFKVPQY